MSGKRSGAGRKSGERERSGERTAEVTENDGAERVVAERERSGERAESSAQRPLRSQTTVAFIKPVPVIIKLNFDLLTHQSIDRVTRLLTSVVSISALVEEIMEK